MSVISLLVSSGSTDIEACQIGPYFNVYVDDTGFCSACFPAITCWPSPVPRTNLFARLSFSATCLAAVFAAAIATNLNIFFNI